MIRSSKLMEASGTIAIRHKLFYSSLIFEVPVNMTIILTQSENGQIPNMLSYKYNTSYKLLW